jgi:hypothetical protein
MLALVLVFVLDLDLAFNGRRPDASVDREEGFASSSSGFGFGRKRGGTRGCWRRLRDERKLAKWWQRA